ncbi:MAG: segregation and condensation protein A [Candidatus Pelagibacterales bacterium]|jgi:segregation and condensation protein A|tara:strand:- start:1091 stop:1891 length:801 start_codon:yes stop_codon:yes gene_type:complete
MSEISDTYSNSQPYESINNDDLIVNLSGYEGPLDVLLIMAKSQKVDLMKISILQLTEQYLVFIAEVRKKNLELAADYLVMAAWLAYLKSNLLLPREETGEELTAEQMAERLKFQLKKLEAIRQVSEKLMNLPVLGTNFFNRGMPEGIRLIRTPEYYLSLYDLLKSYANQRYKSAYSSMVIERPAVYAMEEALVRLQRMVGTAFEWTKLESFLPPEFSKGKNARSGVAGTLAAAMELVREGVLEVQQLAPFGPVFIKNKNNNEEIIG